MMIQRLSAVSVKLRLSADELQAVFAQAQADADSPQMARLISYLLLRAEAVSGIPFSDVPVTVELLRAEDGGLCVYFTAQQPAPCRSPAKRKRSRPVSLAAEFAQQGDLRECCTRLQERAEHIRGSALYRSNHAYILTVRTDRIHAAFPRHILTEYGTPYPMTAVSAARLSEFGSCIHAQNAVQQILLGQKRSDETA